MARPLDTHSDPIVHDLQAIRRLDWSRPEGFRRYKTLLRHPLVRRSAEDPKGDPELVSALRTILREVVARLEAREGSEPLLGRSAAAAGTALLRLSPPFEQMPLEDIRAHIASTWEKPGGDHVSVDGFRLHLEVPEVYEPIAAEFRRLALERADDTDIEIAAESDLTPIARSLIALERERFSERVAHIKQGVVRLLDERQMFEVLIDSIQKAEREFIAVDHVDVAEWFEAPRLHEYLRVQLGLVEDGTLEGERIRLVTQDELEAGGRRGEQLEMLIELHENAGVDLLLCRPETIPELELGFSPHVGLLVIDPSTATPTAITGKLGDGAIGRAMVYTRKTDEVLEFLDEYTRLQTTAREQNRELREQLARSR
jgi:hypothetical protein